MLKSIRLPIGNWLPFSDPSEHFPGSKSFFAQLTRILVKFIQFAAAIYWMLYKMKQKRAIWQLVPLRCTNTTVISSKPTTQWYTFLCEYTVVYAVQCSVFMLLLSVRSLVSLYPSSSDAGRLFDKKKSCRLQRNKRERIYICIHWICLFLSHHE